MTYYQDVGLRDSAALDAFARLRVSNPDTQFDSQAQYDLDTNWNWEHDLTGAAAITHLPDESSAQLATTNSGDVAVRQTKRYFRYRPGKSQLVLITAVFGAAVAGIERMVGYGDDENGIFLCQDESGPFLRYRTSASGSVVDTDVYQADWNGDRMDGTDLSKQTLDLTNGVIFAVDMEWLGLGRTRAMIWQQGQPIILDHRSGRGGDTVYQTTANLPVQYRQEQTAATGATMKAVCCSVISEGGSAVETGRVHSVGNGTTTRSATSGTRVATLTIRPKATFNSITNRALVSPLMSELYVSGNTDAYWELILNGTIGGSPSFASVEADSLVEYDVAGTTITGGHVLASGYAPSAKGGGSPGSILFSDLGLTALALTLDYAGTGQDTLTLAASGIGGTATVAASMTWAEVR